MMYLSVGIRTAASFAALWGLTRLMGVKQISQLTLFDYITGITIGSLTASAIEREGPWLPTLVSVALWSVMSIGTHLAGLKSRKVDQILNDKPTLLVQNGQILEQNLNKVKLTLLELESLLRVKGYFDPGQIQEAYLETSGQISVLPKAQYRPLQPGDLQLKPAESGHPVQVMHEGKPLPEGLRQVKHDEQWLQQELRRQGLSDPSQVFAAWVDQRDQLKVDRNQDQAH